MEKPSPSSQSSNPILDNSYNTSSSSSSISSSSSSSPSSQFASNVTAFEVELPGQIEEGLQKRSSSRGDRVELSRLKSDIKCAPFERAILKLNEDASELITTSEPTTIVSIMSKNPQMRYFMYFCGVITPELSFSMTWYQIISFLWSWMMRFFLVAYVLFYGIVYPAVAPQISHRDQENTDVEVAFFIVLSFNLLMTIPLLLVLCYRQKPFYEFRKNIDDDYNYIPTSKLLNEGVFLAFLYFIFTIVANCEGNCPPGGGIVLCWFQSLFAQFTPVSVVIFAYLATSFQLKYVQAALEREIRAAENGNLTLVRYRGLQKFIDIQEKSNFVTFTILLVIVILQCLTVLGQMFLGEASKTFVAISIVRSSPYILIMFALVWKIADINEKSRKLTLIMAETMHGNSEYVLIHAQQLSKPITFKIFGIFPVYQTDMIISIGGYSISLVVSFVKNTK